MLLLLLLILYNIYSVFKTKIANEFTSKTSQKKAVAVTFHRNDALCCLQTRFGKSVHSPKFVTIAEIFQERRM